MPSAPSGGRPRRTVAWALRGPGATRRACGERQRRTARPRARGKGESPPDCIGQRGSRRRRLWPARPTLAPALTHLVRIAVIGSGIAGLGAAYVLSRAHHVELSSSASRGSGATRTRTTSRCPAACSRSTRGSWSSTNGPTRTSSGCSGNSACASHATDMCFGVKCRRCGLEYASQSLSSLVAQRWRVLDPRHMGMLYRDRPVLPAVPGSSCSPPRATSSRSAAFCRGRASRRASRATSCSRWAEPSGRPRLPT